MEGTAPAHDDLDNTLVLTISVLDLLRTEYDLDPELDDLVARTIRRLVALAARDEP